MDSIAIVVRKSYGVFNDGFEDDDLTHIGVSDGAKYVYSFDELGKHADDDGFDQSIPVLSLSNVCTRSDLMRHHLAWSRQ